MRGCVRVRVRGRAWCVADWSYKCDAHKGYKGVTKVGHVVSALATAITAVSESVEANGSDEDALARLRLLTSLSLMIAEQGCVARDRRFARGNRGWGW